MELLPPPPYFVLELDKRRGGTIPCWAATKDPKW